MPRGQGQRDGKDGNVGGFLTGPRRFWNPMGAVAGADFPLRVSGSGT
jgi:hypothetical protein